MLIVSYRKDVNRKINEQMIHKIHTVIWKNGIVNMLVKQITQARMHTYKHMYDCISEKN